MNKFLNNVCLIFFFCHVYFIKKTIINPYFIEQDFFILKNKPKKQQL